MRTKVLNKQQKKLDFDKNLLNNQNYILWKTEKKKLLSKFFVEKNILFIQIFLYKLDQIVEKHKIMILYFSFSGLGMIPLYFLSNFFYLKYLTEGFYLFLWYFVSSFISVISFTLYFYIFDNKIYWDKFISIKSFKSYLMNKQMWFIWLFVFIALLFISLSWFGLLFEDIKMWLILLFWWLISFWFIYSIRWIFRLKLLNIIFLPVFIIIELFLLIYNLFKFFIFKWVKWFNITKLEPKTSLINKFSRIYRNYAENKYYKIQQK